MKVFVAMGPGEKKRPDDFSWTVDGELVSLPLDTCSCPDCGCERAVAGLASSKGTTTFGVLDHPALDAAGYVGAFSDAVKRQGWRQHGDDDGWVAEWAGEHLRLATAFSPGQVLEMRDGKIQRR
jgi:hypothetical protein